MLASEERMGEALPLDLPASGFHPINEGALAARPGRAGLHSLAMPILHVWLQPHARSEQGTACQAHIARRHAVQINAKVPCAEGWGPLRTHAHSGEMRAGVDFAKAYRLGMRGPFQRFTQLTWGDRRTSALRTWLLHHANSLARMFTPRARYFRACLVC